MINRLPAGKRIPGFPNLAKLRSTPGAIEIAFNHDVGRRVPAVEDDRSRNGYVIVAADNCEATCALAERIERELVCLIDRGEGRAMERAPICYAESRRGDKPCII